MGFGLGESSSLFLNFLICIYKGGGRNVVKSYWSVVLTSFFLYFLLINKKILIKHLEYNKYFNRNQKTNLISLNSVLSR